MKESIENIYNIKKENPTNTLSILGYGPMDCEKQAAAIRNGTIDCIEKEDIRALAYRYLQNIYNEGQARNEMKFWGVIFWGVVSTLYIFANGINHDLRREGHEEEYIAIIIQIGLLLAGLACTGPLFHIIPNLANTLRYEETKEVCEDWLKQKIGPDAVCELEKLPFDKIGFFETNELLNKINISAADPNNIPTRFRGL